MVLQGHEEGEEGLGRDPEGLQQVPLLEYPDHDDHNRILINLDDDDNDNGESVIYGAPYKD